MGYEEEREDTLRILMTDSREKLAAVTQVIERGRITRNKRAIQQKGPWCIGTLYKTELLEIDLWVAPRCTSIAPEVLKYMRQVTYICVKGKANIHTRTGYVRLGQGTVSHIASGDTHNVEPIEDGTQLTVILVGAEDQEY